MRNRGYKLNLVMKLLAICWPVLLCLPVHALEISSAKGAVILGRPLDLRVSIKLDTPDEDPCVDSQVYFAESRLAALSQWNATAGAASGVLRVTTTRVVDEPIVTLYVNVGCSQRMARKFIFFAEVDSQGASSVVVGQALNAVTAFPKSVPAASSLQPSQATAQEGEAGKTKKTNTVTRKTKADSSIQPTVSHASNGLRADVVLGGISADGDGKKSRQGKTSQPAKSRLRLEPLDLQAPPGLKTSMEMTLPSVDANSSTRASAAALWKAINSSPEDWLRENERMRVLEGQLGSMQSKLLAQQELLAKVQDDMDRQRSYAFGLGGLLALALLAVGFVWMRKRNSDGSEQPWWKERKSAWLGSTKQEDKTVESETEQTVPIVKSNQPPDAFFKQEPAQLHLGKEKKVKVALKSQTASELTTPDGASNTEKSGASHADKPVKTSRKKKQQDEVELDTLRTAKIDAQVPSVKLDAGRESLAESTSSFPPELDSVPPIPEIRVKPKSEQAVNSAFESFFGVELTGKNYDVQELFDVQEQSEFFITVGQHDQAIEILLNHIDANPEGSPLAYLDLFALYHKLGKRPEYETLAARFTVHFNARIPSFDGYGSERSRSLENYTAAMTRIQLLWPSEKTLNVIAESIFRKPETPESAFSLEAYQELLLLYGILKEIHENENPAPDFVASGFQDSGFGSGFQSTRMEALPTVDLAPSQVGLDGSSVLDAKDSGHSESLLEFDVYTPPKSSRLGLDIDLAEPDSIGEEKPLPIKKSKVKNSRH